MLLLLKMGSSCRSSSSESTAVQLAVVKCERLCCFECCAAATAVLARSGVFLGANSCEGRGGYPVRALSAAARAAVLLLAAATSILGCSRREQRAA